MQSEPQEIDSKTGLSKKPLSGYFSGVMNHMKFCLGSGIFAMGFSLKNAGMAVGIPLMIILAIPVLHCQHLLLKVGKEIESFTGTKPDFATAAKGVFKYGPEKVRKFERSMHIFTNITFVATQTGILCVYIIFFANSMMRVAELWNYTAMSIQMWVLIAFPPIIITSSLLRNLKLLGYLSFIANSLIVTGALLTVYLILSDLPEKYTFEWIGDLLNLPMFISITFLAYCAIQVVLPIYMESNVPEKIASPLGILNVSTAIEAFLTILIGFLSYLRYGKDCKGSVTLNLEPGVVTQIVVVFIGSAVMLSYTLNMYVVVESIFPLISEKWGPFKYPNVGIFIFKLSYTILTFIMAWTVPMLGQFVALVGAFGNTTLSLLLPVLLHLVISWERSHFLVKTKDFFILILGVISMVAGIASAIRDIAMEIHNVYHPREAPPPPSP